jgi:hypothetical protein
VPFASNLIFAAVFLVCAVLGAKPGAMRQVMAYIGAIGLGVAGLGPAGAILMGRIDAKGYVMFFAGMLLGAVAGVVVGILLGKWAASNVWVYGALVILDVALMVLTPVLVSAS